MFDFGIWSVGSRGDILFRCTCEWYSWPGEGAHRIVTKVRHPERHEGRRLDLCRLHTVRFQRTLRRIIREHPDVVID